MLALINLAMRFGSEVFLLTSLRLTEHLTVLNGPNPQSLGLAQAKFTPYYAQTCTIPSYPLYQSMSCGQVTVSEFLVKKEAHANGISVNDKSPA